MIHRHWFKTASLLLLIFSAGCKPSGKASQAAADSISNPPPNGVKTAAERVSEKLRAIRQAGYPATMEDLTNWPTAGPPDSLNGAIYWTDAFSAVVPIPTGAPDFPPRNKLLSAANRSYFQGILASNGIALERMQKARTIEHSRYPSDLLLVKEQQRLAGHLYKSARVVKLEALIQSENRNPGLAVGAIETLVALARSLQETPNSAYGYHTGVLLGYASEATERLIGENELDRGQLAKLQAVFHSPSLSDTLTRDLVAFRCIAIHNFQNWRVEILPTLADQEQSNRGHNNEPFPADELPAFAAKFDQRRDADLLFYLDVMEEAIAASRLPYPDSLLAARKVAFRVEEQYRLPRDQQCAGSLLILPFFESIATSMAAQTAALETAECAVAVERYRLDHQGLLPINLAALTPVYLAAVPTDPFDGKPLRFKWLPKGYVVYSIGKDCRDNGGKEPPGLDGGVIGSDITFTVER